MSIGGCQSLMPILMPSICGPTRLTQRTGADPSHRNLLKLQKPIHSIQLVYSTAIPVDPLHSSEQVPHKDALDINAGKLHGFGEREKKMTFGPKLEGNRSLTCKQIGWILAKGKQNGGTFLAL
jgi:hypothetical protein